MVKVKLNFPIDASFLSELMYEGILYSLEKHGISFSLKEAELEDKFAQKIFESLNEEDYHDININFVSINDRKNIAKLFKMFDVPEAVDNNLNRIFYELRNNYKKILVKSEIDLKMTVKGKKLLFDVVNKNNGVSLQLLKLDRYTGLSSTESPYTSKQLTPYYSPELIIIAFLGILSSYVITKRTAKSTFHYFLFFSPDEISGLLSGGEKERLNTHIRIKKQVKKTIKDVLAYTHFNEALLLELAVNASIHKAVGESQIDKVSTMLFKVSPEGQTYKIYEVLHLPIFRETIFREKIEKYFDDYEGVSVFIQNFLKNRTVKNALRSLNMEKKYTEADQIVIALRNLYKFVILGDIEGWLTFIRQLWNAHEKTKNEKGISNYLELLRGVPW